MDAFPAAKFGIKVLKDEGNGSSSSSSYLVSDYQGKEVKIAMAELEELADTMRQNANTKLGDIDQSLMNKFNQLRYYVKILQDSGKYPILYRLIKSKFKDIKTVMPGTIGSFCNGCSVAVDGVGNNQSCSPLCAGSLQQNESAELCKATVMLGDYNEGMFNFTGLCKSEDLSTMESPAVMYVNFTCYDDFPGFTASEIEKLKRFEIQAIQFMRYSADGTSAIPLINRVLELKDIKTRHEGEMVQSSGSGTPTVIFISILFIIMIVCFIVIVKSRNK